jgi:hypothetical protein
MIPGLPDNLTDLSAEELEQLHTRLSDFCELATSGPPLPKAPPPAAKPPEELAAPGRDSAGRFTAGNPGGCGNPFARQVAQFRKALYEAVDLVQFKMLVERLWEMAFRGNLQAAKLLLQYLVGKPADVVNPDRLDADEWRNLQDSAIPPAQLTALLHQMPAGMACDIADPAWPCFIQRCFELGWHGRPAPEVENVAKAKKPRKARPSTNGPSGASNPAPGDKAESIAAENTTADRPPTAATAEAPPGETSLCCPMAARPAEPASHADERPSPNTEAATSGAATDREDSTAAAPPADALASPRSRPQGLERTPAERPTARYAGGTAPPADGADGDDDRTTDAPVDPRVGVRRPDGGSRMRRRDEPSTNGDNGGAQPGAT